MAIFNENYIKEYENNKKQNLNESLLAIGLILILSPFILLFSAIAILSMIDDKIKINDIKKREINFKALMKKYPQLRDTVISIVRKVQDFLIKKIKLKYNELKYINIDFKNYNIKYDKNNDPSLYCSAILYTDPGKYLKTTELSKYLDYNSSGEYYVINNIEEYTYASDKNEYNRLYKLYENICNDLYTDYDEIDKYLELCNEELKNYPNGDSIKLYSYIDEPGESDSDFPIYTICIEIDITKIKMTDEVKAKIEELKSKSGKYFKR